MMRDFKIYLAGGMKSGWQDEAYQEILVKAGTMNPDVGIFFLDPRHHKATDPDAYTLIDLQWIRNSDLVFAYMEDTNPGGPNLALEIGYAHALGIPVIFVNEREKYWGMAETVSVMCANLEEAAHIAANLAVGNTDRPARIRVKLDKWR